MKRHRADIVLLLPSSGAALGDVFPYVSIGVALLDAGHSVILAVDERIKNLLKMTVGIDSRFEVKPISVPARRDYNLLLKLPIPNIKYIVHFIKEALPANVAAYRFLVRYVEERGHPDIIVGNASGRDEIIGDSNTLAVTLAISPGVYLPRGNIEEGFVSAVDSSLLKFTWKLLERFYLISSGASFFPSRKGKRKLVLGLWSRVLTDGFELNDSRLKVSGFVYPPWSAPLPVDLEEFLHSGPPPVVFLFGSHVKSMGGGDRIIAVARELASLGGERAVVVRITKSVEAGTESVFLAPFVDLDQLIPRAAAVICHAGIGTLGSCLRGGVPAIMFPMMFDQPSNADLFERLGAGIRLDHTSEFNAPSIHNALQQVREETNLEKVRKLSSRVHAEETVRNVVDAIESVLE